MSLSRARPLDPSVPRLGVIDTAAALTVVLIWAFNFIAAKTAVGQFPPLFMLAIRFALVAVLLAGFLRPLRRQFRPVLLLSAVLGTGHFGLLFIGLRGIDAGPAAVAIQLTAPFSALLAALFYRERLNRWQLVGMTLAFAGIYVLGGSATDHQNIVDLLLVVVAAFAWAVANVVIKRIGPINVFVLNAWVALLACPQVLVLSVLLEKGQFEAARTATWLAWAAIGYMVLGASITAYGLWYYLIGKHEMNRVVPLTLLSPVLAVGFAAWLLGERITWPIVIGGAVTILGVGMIQFLGARRQPPGSRR